MLHRARSSSWQAGDDARRLHAALQDASAHYDPLRPLPRGWLVPALARKLLQSPVVFAPLLLVALTAAPPALTWRTLSPGVEATEVPLGTRSDIGDSIVTVVRVDPTLLQVTVLAAKTLELVGGKPARQWLEDSRLLVVTNAGMFAADRLSTVGYGRAGATTLNPKWKPEYGAALVAGPRKPGLPEVRILDRDCDDLAKESANYQYVIQSIRMIDCKGRNSWGPRKQRYSSMIAAVDGEGRLLLLHCRSPYVMHDYIDHLRAIPALGLKRAIYLEGGPEATLRVEGPSGSLARVGSYETGFFERDDNQVEWDLPNVLAVQPRRWSPGPPGAPPPK